MAAFCYDWKWVENPDRRSMDRNYRSQNRQYCCDSTADIAALPGIPQGLAPGSTAIVKGGNTYMLWPDNTWGMI
jgi:hypothetical protein